MRGGGHLQRFLVGGIAAENQGPPSWGGGQGGQHLVDPFHREGLGIANFGQQMAGDHGRPATVSADPLQGPEGLVDLFGGDRFPEIPGEPGMPQPLCFARAPDGRGHDQGNRGQALIGLESGGQFGMKRANRVVGEDAGLKRIADCRTFAQHLDDRIDVGRKFGVPAGRFDLIGEPGPAGRVGFDDEDAPAADLLADAERRRTIGRRHRHRKGEPIPVALAGLMLGPDFTAHQPNQFVGDPKSQSSDAERSVGRGVHRHEVIE